nr:M15 family metallopeptidase [Rhodoferax sp.]
MRSCAEQDALYAQGRTAPGNKVTNAKSGDSNHNFGIAFDIGVRLTV